MRCWKLQYGSIMPVGDMHVIGSDDIPLTRELGAKQWLREINPAAYAHLLAVMNSISEKHLGGL
jgi:hypothetical protein